MDPDLWSKHKRLDRIVTEICERIALEFKPYDIFSPEDLDAWAKDNGYVKEADHEQD